MIPSGPENKPIVIIAHRGPGNHLEGLFKDFKLWFKNIIVVGPRNSYFSQIIKDNGGSWVDSDSYQINELWLDGIKAVPSDWYILVQDTEYLSSVLKESITEVIFTSQTKASFFPFDRKIFFLKQRLKYNLDWAHEPSSGLLFISSQPSSLDDIYDAVKKEPLKGDLIHFRERTSREVIQNSFPRADWLADQLYKNSPDLNKRMLVFNAIKYSSKNFFKTWLIKRGVREGFEGLVFCLLDSAVILLGYLRYYEKYLRSGRQIEDQRDMIKKILVIKVRGLGDAVLATPVLKNLKTLMNDVSVSVLTFNFCKSLFKNNPHIDKIYSLSGDPSQEEIKKIIKTLNNENFDLIINLHSRNFSSRLARKIKSRWRISRSYFIREKYTDVMIGSDHELDRTSIERDLDCLRAIGLDPLEKEPEIFITEKEKEWAKQKLEEIKVNLSKKLIMIHPTCSQPYKNWGMDQFVKLSQHLMNDCGHQVMGIFSLTEKPLADLLQDQLDGVFIYVGPLRPSMALIQQADLMIDNDSGPAHISQALNVSTLVLVGPDYKNAYRDENIYEKGNHVFYKDIPCRDLFLSRCLPPDPCQNRICMDHSVEEVFTKAQELLKK